MDAKHLLTVVAVLLLGHPIFASLGRCALARNGADKPTHDANIRRLVSLKDQQVQLSSSDTNVDADAFVAALGRAMEAIHQLQLRVGRGQLISNFGVLVDGVVEDAAARAGGARAQVESALDGVLHSLFLRQLAILRDQVLSKFEKSYNPEAARLRAEQTFAKRAKALVRPRSDWSFEPQLEELSAALQDMVRRQTLLMQERARGAATQRSSVDVIGRLQSQMERLHDIMQEMGGGGPWVLSTTYRIPKTPLRLRGRYQAGRTNIEVTFAPDADPVNAEAGFVRGLTPANVGLSLNMGV